MNWYKTTQIEQTLDYFQELEEYGDFVPDVHSIYDKLEKTYGVEVVTEVGRGDSGIAYLLSDGNILKITTNAKEGKIAQWLLNNPNPYIAQYKDVWKEGDLYYIIMERVEPLDDNLYLIISQINNMLEKRNIYNVNKAISLIQNSDISKDYPNITRQIIDYFIHLENSGISFFDFLNPNNVGQKDGKLKFFDIN